LQEGKKCYILDRLALFHPFHSYSWLMCYSICYLIINMTSKSLEMPPQNPPTPGFFPKVKRQTQGVDLSGQVAIITGANTGLDFHYARHLLALKLSGLILAVRSRENGEEAVAKLQKEFPAVRLEVWELEMTSYESIQSFARRFGTDLVRFDITISILA